MASDFAQFASVEIATVAVVGPLVSVGRINSWPVLQHRTAGELDRSGRRSLEGWNSRRTLGCHSGRGYRATVQERESDVRRLVPEVNTGGTSSIAALACSC